MAKRPVLRGVVLLACVTAVGSVHATGPARQGTRSPAPASPAKPDGPTKPDLAADVVGGRVLSTSGQPIAHAVVTLADVATGTEQATARSGSDGRYRFGPVSTGKYRLGARAAGYIDGFYQGHQQFSTAIVLGAGLPTGALDLQLTPEAVISGRVTDEAGDAIHNAQVTLFRRLLPGAAPAESEETGTRATRFRSASTADTGEFRLEKVPPGTYILAVSGTPWYATHAPLVREGQGFQYRAAVDPALDVAFPQVFYPGATDPEQASPIDLKGGEKLVANLQLHAERAVSVQVQMPAQEGPSSGFGRFPQLSRTVFGVTEQIRAQAETDGSTVRFTGLVPGRYRVQDSQQNGTVQRGSIDVTGAGATLNLADLGRAQTSLTLKVQLTGGAALPAGLQLRLRGLAGVGQATVKVAEDGTADAQGVGAGTYRVEVLQGSRVLPLLGLAVQGKAVPDLRLRVPQGEGKLAVVASAALRATRLEGFVRRQGKPVSGTMVILVPAGPATSIDFFRRDQSDLDGSFVLNGVVPGNYLLLAVEDGWSLPWTDTAAMARYLSGGVPVTVPSGAGAVLPVGESVVPQIR